jgi:hypothetical protein
MHQKLAAILAVDLADERTQTRAPLSGELATVQ